MFVFFPPPFSQILQFTSDMIFEPLEPRSSHVPCIRGTIRRRDNGAKSTKTYAITGRKVVLKAFGTRRCYRENKTRHWQVEFCQFGRIYKQFGQNWQHNAASENLLFWQCDGSFEEAVTAEAFPEVKAGNFENSSVCIINRRSLIPSLISDYKWIFAWAECSKKFAKFSQFNNWLMSPSMDSISVWGVCRNVSKMQFCHVRDIGLAMSA